MAERLHADRFQREVDAPADLLARHADVFGAERDVVLDDRCDRLVVGILKDHARAFADLEGLFIVGGIHAEHGNGAGGRNEEGVDEFGEGGFAAAVAAQDRDELPLFNG